MIRTSKHYLNDLNTNKFKKYSLFIKEYRRITKIIVEHIWEFGYENYHPRLNQFELPRFIDYNKFDFITTNLSARALSSLTTQISGILRSATEKQRKRLYIYSIKPNNKLLKSITKFNTSCPRTDNIHPELSSKCIDYISSQNKNVHGYLRIKSIGKAYGFIKIPIMKHRHSIKFEQKNYNLMNSFLLADNHIDMRWQKEIPLKIDGDIVGLDQGQITTVTLSDGQITNKNKHGYDLKLICDIMARKKKGSKSFKRCQKHRDNYINWSIKQLNFNKIKQINFEKVKNLRYGQKTSSSLKHFTYTSIEKQVANLCQLNGVHLIEHGSAFYSQRCSKCGWVQKQNRKGKCFTCKLCKHDIDADLNAAMNHEMDLPSALSFVKSNINKSGFFWLSDGFYNRFGQELRVPDSFTK